MASTSETGHAKNVANFEDLISFCEGYGAVYNPSKDALKIANITSQFQNAQSSLAGVKTSQATFNTAVNNRVIVFKPLKALGTRIINALDSTDASKETVKDARTINRKLQGQRAEPKPKEEKETDPAAPPADKTISASQQSYDQQIEHFAKLIELLTVEPGYDPNEVELKLTTLIAKLAELKAANTAAINQFTNWSNRRIERNDIIYNPLTGVVATALDIKKYIKSVYGASSPQYKQVSGLQFRMRKD